MTAAPFRDLFVELPRALFEALQGIGEAAVEKARAPAAPLRRSPIMATLDKLQSRPVHALLCERYGWRAFGISRLPGAPFVRLIGRLVSCRHSAVLELPEMLFAEGPAAIIDAIDKAVEETERCYCVPKERPWPLL